MSTMKQKEAIDKYKQELISNIKAYLRILFVISALFIGIIMGVKSHATIDIVAINTLTSMFIAGACILMVFIIYLDAV